MARRFFDAVLFVSAPLFALACLSIAALAFYAGHLMSPVRIGLYAGVPLTLSAVLILIMTVWWPHRWLVVAHLAAAGIALIATETWLAYEDLRINIAAVENSAPDTKTRTNHVCPRQLAALGGVESSAGRLLPIGGVGRNLIHVALADGSRSDLTTDRFGFNNPDDVWSAATTDIFVVGDSFAFGADVAPGHGFVDLVRKNYPGTINLGCGGNGPLSEFAGLIEYGPERKPRFVVWSYYEGNDLTKDLLDELAAPTLRAYFDNVSKAQQGLIEKQDAIDVALREFLASQLATADQTVAKPRMRWIDVALFRNLRTRLGLSYGFRPHALDDLSRLIATSRDLIESWDGELVFLYLPGEVRYRTLFGRADANGYKDAVLERIESLGVRTVDAAAVFDATPAPENLFAGHYTNEGYALVADILLSALPKNP